MDNKAPRHPNLNRFGLLRLIALSVPLFFIFGASLRAAVLAIIIAALAAAGFLVESRTTRPIRSFLRLALFSALLFAVLVVDVALSGGTVALGVVAWLGMTCLGVIWTCWYERSETIS
jgi:hypothetical protein